jgi:hypothetical protein
VPIRERIKIFRVRLKRLRKRLIISSQSEEIDDLVDVRIIETGNNSADVALVIYRKKDEGAFSFG